MAAKKKAVKKVAKKAAKKTAKKRVQFASVHRDVYNKNPALTTETDSVVKAGFLLVFEALGTFGEWCFIC